MPENRSTTVQGNDFRGNVKRLLDLTPGCGNVQTECPIGSQPVDLSHLVTGDVGKVTSDGSRSRADRPRLRGGRSAERRRGRAANMVVKQRRSPKEVP
jgi:hypothetical protein